MQSRALTLADGVVGPEAETYSYDGLNRLTSASSGGVTTEFTFDSLSRTLSEGQPPSGGGRQVAYSGYDDAGNLTQMSYSSGSTVNQAFDPLNRLAGVSETGAGSLATFGYRGAYLRSEVTYGNGLSSQKAFDSARRLVSDTARNAGGSLVHGENIAWSPRSLKVAQTRTDQGREDLLFAYDGASRLVQRKQSGEFTAKGFGPPTDVPNNSVLGAAQLTALPNGEGFAYDATQNLVSEEMSFVGIGEPLAFSGDSSGRHRPASIGGMPLEWDANGNLVRKGDQRYKYDFRNRLTEVTDLSGSIIASYAYDAFNRRVERSFGGDTEETVWSGWRAVETYRNGLIAERRTFGGGLDEVVYLEADLSGNGILESATVPLYDSTGNVVASTSVADGRVLERYSYSAYGDVKITADLGAPTIEQVRIVGDELWLEVSEEVQADALAKALTAGDFEVVRVSDLTPYEIAISQPVNDGRNAGERVVVSFVTPPVSAEAVTLDLAGSALVDSFLNEMAAAYHLDIAWPGLDTVLVDNAAPEVLEVVLKADHLELEFSEPVTSASAAAAILLDGDAYGWSMDQTGYRLTSVETVSEGTHDLVVDTGLTDLSGTAIASTFEVSFETSALAPDVVAYSKADPREIESSSVGNRNFFHGRPVDDETGFIYMRNRYFDPQMGRFITPDPMGFIDGPNQYAFAGNDPANKTDPLGLYEYDTHNYLTRFLAERAGFTAQEAKKIGFETQELDMDDRLAIHGFGKVLFGAEVVLGFLNQSPLFISTEMMEKYHFVNLGRMKELRENSYRRKKLDSLAFRDIGTYLHAFEDSFSHQEHPTKRDYLQRNDTKYGHLKGGHKTDWTWDRSELAMEMARSTYIQLMGLCYHFKGASCKSESFDSFRKTVEDFVKYDKSPIYMKGYWEKTVGDYRGKIKELDPGYTVTKREYEKLIKPYEGRWKIHEVPGAAFEGFQDFLSDPARAWGLGGVP